MKKHIFKTIAKLNKKVLPSYSKKDDFDLRNASKAQMAIIGWKLWVTKNSLD
ncbi:SsrA-binding protein [Christiangramia sp.]|uniref:SsrA-binding protein n=1 Tax=Christiangramia sp. TaxID=1931228 RepID=UPI0026399D5D|nr:SsrA-binding protein [Christiangramia sp.]